MRFISRVFLSILPFLVCGGLLSAAIFIKPKSVGKRVDPPIFELRDKYFGVAVPSRETIWLAGNHGKVVRTEDGGENWHLQQIPGEWNVQDIAAWDTETAVVVGNSGKIALTTNGGQKWTEVAAPLSDVANKLMRVKITADGRAWAVGEMGALLVSLDRGRTWTRKLEERDVGLTDIHFVNPNRGWVVGEFGTMLLTENGGDTWTERTGSVESTLMGIAFRDEENGIAVGLAGTILHTADAGDSWMKVPVGTNENLFSLDWDGGSWVVAGNQGTILRGDKDALNWDSVRAFKGDLHWRTEVLSKFGKTFLAGDSSGSLQDGIWIAFNRQQ